jgi:hypothetical protein
MADSLTSRRHNRTDLILVLMKLLLTLAGNSTQVNGSFMTLSYNTMSHLFPALVETYSVNVLRISIRPFYGSRC